MSSNEGPRPFVNESNNSLGGDTSILNHKIANDSTDEDVFFSFEILHCDPTKEEAYGDCWAGWVDPSIKDGFCKHPERQREISYLPAFFSQVHPCGARHLSSQTQ